MISSLVSVLLENFGSIGAHLWRPTDPHFRETSPGSLSNHPLAEVLPSEFYISCIFLDLLSVLAHSQDNLEFSFVFGQPRELAEGNRVNIFGLVDGDKEDKLEFLEGFLF